MDKFGFKNRVLWDSLQKKKFVLFLYFFGLGGFEILKIGWGRVWTLPLCFVRQSKMGEK